MFLKALQSDNFSISLSDRKSHLEENIDQDHQDGEGEVEEEPDLHRLDVGGAGEAGGDGQVDRGQDHHAGDVDGVDHATGGGT